MITKLFQLLFQHTHSQCHRPRKPTIFSLVVFLRLHNLTQLPVKFCHIHGSRIEAVIADGHKGQGLGGSLIQKLGLLLTPSHSGFGQYCVALCHDIQGFCSGACHCQLRGLGPYDHLRHCYRYCVIHFWRNVATLRPSVTPEVYRAMLKISSFEAHDLEATLSIIHSRGQKAKGIAHKLQYQQR